jgi:hypothetical protein
MPYKGSRMSGFAGSQAPRFGKQERPRGMRLAAVVNSRTARPAPLSQLAVRDKVNGTRLSKETQLSQRASSLDESLRGAIGTVRYVNGRRWRREGVRRGRGGG